jgi:Iron-dependent Transcriptional regulator
MAMRLSEYTDDTLRVLMYCAAHRDRLVTIGELAEQHGLSKNHLMKVVNDLARQGLLETTRGRGGGRLLLAAARDHAHRRCGATARPYGRGGRESSNSLRANAGHAPKGRFGGAKKTVGPWMGQRWATDGPQSKKPPIGAAFGRFVSCCF